MSSSGMGPLPGIGGAIAQYEILAKLGEGGMGVVYRARDIHLQRDVALKVLRPGTLGDESARAMFRKEAQALARLSHPNIAAVYEFNTAGAVDYLVTEYVPGDAVADMLRGSQVPEPEVRRLGCRIADALRAAHEKGVAHCDLTPKNVMVTPAGEVKLLDFGLARFLRPADDSGETATTQTLRIAGTPPYMAPEQLRGAPADPRTDIYAAGALLYELAAGRRPFPESGAAALIDAILNRPPEPPRSLRPEISSELERVILKCLDKKPEGRYQSAADLAQDLEPPAPPTAGRGFQIPWRIVAWSFAALTGSGLLGFSWLATGHPALPFAPRDWVLVADFENQTGNPVFDTSLRTAFEVSLQQSKVVNVFPRARARDTLRRMRRAGSEPIDEALGQEIASRESIKALILPAISGVGREYRLAARIREVSTSVDVKTRIVRARNQDHVLNALDQLAAGLRKDLGESFFALARNNRPLQQVTTGSLEALRQFSLAVEKHKAADYPEARLLYEEALRIDPQFTAARAALGMLLYEKFDPKAGAARLDEAMPDLDRLTPQERYGILAFHAAAVERNLEKAAGFDKSLIAEHPDDSAAHNNLGFLYTRMRRYPEAVVELREALRIDPHFQLARTSLSYALLFGLGNLDAVIEACKPQLAEHDQDPWMLANLGWAYLGKARLPDAETVFQRSAEMFPKFSLNRYRLGMTRRFERRWDDALQVFEGILAADPTECFAHYESAMTHEAAKQDEAARRDFGRARTCLDRDLQANAKDAAARLLLATVLYHLGERSAAAQEEQKGLALDSRLQFEAAAVSAAAGDPERALDRLEAAVRQGFDNFVWMYTHAEFQRLRGRPRFDALLRAHLKGMGDLP